MPIVASMGGIAGNQTLTLMIRGIALGQVSKSNARKLLNKELLVGALNGMIWALIVAAVVVFAHEGGWISLVLFLILKLVLWFVQRVRVR